MMNFKSWFIETNTHAKNQLATLVQQGIGAGDIHSWQSILKMVKNGNDTHNQALRQLISGYMKHEGKPGSAARYLMSTLDDLEHDSDKEHFGEKARSAINQMQETLGKLHIPIDLADELLQVLEAESSSHTFMMQRQYLGNSLMVKIMPIFVKIGEHLLARQTEQEAKNAMIELLGDMTYFSEHVPSPDQVFSQVRKTV